MRKFGFIPLFCALSTAAIVFAAFAFASPPGAVACGGSLWRLTTLSDTQRAEVTLVPRPTTIGSISEREAPKRLPHRRTTPFQKQTWQVVAEITDYRLIGHVLHLTLYDDGMYLDAALPIPQCVPLTARARASMLHTWTKFTSSCGHPTGRPQPLGAVGYVNGIGFWSRARTGHGIAPNGASLRPVTGFRLVAGCR